MRLKEGIIFFVLLTCFVFAHAARAVAPAPLVRNGSSSTLLVEEGAVASLYPREIPWFFRAAGAPLVSQTNQLVPESLSLALLGVTLTCASLLLMRRRALQESDPG